MDVAAVVVTYNSDRYIANLLDSIPAAMADLSYSIVVVDNGSTDATLAILNDRSDCVIVRSVNDGYAAGINRAVRFSSSAQAILIQADRERWSESNSASLHQTQGGSFPSARFKRVCARRGYGKALVAVQHSMSTAVWHMLSTGEFYHDLGGDYYTRPNPQRSLRRRMRDLEAGAG